MGANSETILIIDEKQIHRDLLGLLFKHHGYEAVTAIDAGEAMGRLREHPVHLIVMDLELPRMHGLELLERIRQNGATRYMPVVVLTDSREKRNIVRAASLGVRDYVLRNCFSSDRFMERVRQLLSAPSPAMSIPALVPAPPGAVAIPSAPKPAAPARVGIAVKSAAAVASPNPAPADINKTPRLLTRERTLERLDAVAGGKTIAGVVAQVVAVASSPNADMSDVVRVIQSDPILASRVLQMANSASTGLRTRVHSVEEAARTIGVRGIQNMAISIGIFGTFPPDELDGFNTIRCWQHSFAVAALMGTMVRQRNPELEGLHHLVGLCHDLGEILLRQHFIPEYEQIVQFAMSNSLPVHQVESLALGIRHPELISRLLTKIGLPSNVVDAIREFYDRQSKDQAAGMSADAQLLQMANSVAHGLLLTPSTYETIRPITRTEWRNLASDKAPPTLDPALKRSEILIATSSLARMPAREEERLVLPLISRSHLRLAYVRPEMFIELDPVGFALQLVADTAIFQTLPPADQLSEFDALVVVGLRAGLSPVIQDELIRLTAAAGKPALPILALVGQSNASAANPSPLTCATYPFRLRELQNWLEVVQQMKSSSQAAAVSA